MCFKKKAYTESVLLANSDAKAELVKFGPSVSKIRLENDNKQLFYRIHLEAKCPDVKLIVNSPTNKLVFYKDGVASPILGSGAYRLYEEDEYKEKKFLFFKTGEKVLKENHVVDIILYNPELTYEGFWGTPEKIPYRDPETGVPVGIQGRGKYDIRIADVEKFHTRLVGSDPNFTVDTLLDRINDYIAEIVRSELVKIIHEMHLGYIDLPLYEREISQAIQPVISEMFNDHYGIYVPLFAVNQFGIEDEEREEIERILKENRDEAKYKKDVKELAAEAERLDDKMWEREKFLIGLRREDKDKYLEVMKILGYPSAPLNKLKEEHENSKLGKRFCPKCGSEVKPGETFCSSCGAQLQETQRVCPHCKKIIKTKGKYCPHCGKEL